MKTRTFLVVLYSVLALLSISTLAHFAYCVYAYQHCSIIEFIAKELW